jgi:hypothetical protein
MQQYDRLKALQAIRSGRAASRLPGSELILGLADQLEAGGEELLTAEKRIREAKDDALNYKQQFEAEREDHRKLREAAAGLEPCIAALKDIAENAKGAKARAEAVLTEIGVINQEEEKPSEPAQ